MQHLGNSIKGEVCNGISVMFLSRMLHRVFVIYAKTDYTKNEKLQNIKFSGLLGSRRLLISGL